MVPELAADLVGGDLEGYLGGGATCLMEEAGAKFSHWKSADVVRVGSVFLNDVRNHGAKIGAIGTTVKPYNN